MLKEKNILIRIDWDLKQKAEQNAKLLGLSTSAFIRMLIIKEVGK